MGLKPVVLGNADSKNQSTWVGGVTHSAELPDTASRLELLWDLTDRNGVCRYICMEGNSSVPCLPVIFCGLELEHIPVP